MSNEKEFPENQWEPLRQAMQTEGPQGAVGFVQTLSDPEQRRKLFLFGQGAFGVRDWEGKNWDDHIRFTQAGIQEGLDQAEALLDPAQRDALVDFANLLSYNLSADLCDCWPGDRIPRTKEHFETGLRLVEQCLVWRTQFKKGPMPFYLAHWAKGMHLISLSRPEEAIEAFQAALECAQQIAREKEKSTEKGPDAHWSVLGVYGYQALAERLAEREEGAKHFDEACSALSEAGEKYPDEKGDHRFMLDQVLEVETRYLNP